MDCNLLVFSSFLDHYIISGEVIGFRLFHTSSSVPYASCLPFESILKGLASHTMMPYKKVRHGADVP